MKTIAVNLSMSDEDCAALTQWADKSRTTVEGFLQMFFGGILEKIREGKLDPNPPTGGNVVPFKKRGT